MKICPSIASCDVMNLEKMTLLLDKNYHHIHIDIEDGNYINNITFGMKVVKGIRRLSDCELSLHLMVTDAMSYIQDLTEIKPAIVFIHPDTCLYPSLVIDSYKNAGISVGLAFNPCVGIDNYAYLFEKTEDVLIMMCEPDGYDQKYIKGMEKKIKQCVDLGLKVWADGAINEARAERLTSLGAENLVMGRAVANKLK